MKKPAKIDIAKWSEKVNKDWLIKEMIYNYYLARNYGDYKEAAKILQLVMSTLRLDKEKVTKEILKLIDDIQRS